MALSPWRVDSELKDIAKIVNKFFWVLVANESQS